MGLQVLVARVESGHERAPDGVHEVVERAHRELGLQPSMARNMLWHCDSTVEGINHLKPPLLAALEDQRSRAMVVGVHVVAPHHSSNHLTRESEASMVRQPNMEHTFDLRAR